MSLKEIFKPKDVVNTDNTLEKESSSDDLESINEQITDFLDSVKTLDLDSEENATESEGIIKSITFEKDTQNENFFSGSYFYDIYLEEALLLKRKWQMKLKSLSISELFDIVRNRYASSPPLDLASHGDMIKNDICFYAEKELRERAKKLENKKTCYHILGELLCRSFNANNDFNGNRWGECDDLVEWIRERYVYLYANLAETDFKTECQSALDMIDLDGKLEDKLKTRYVSLEKKQKSHTTQKNIKLEGQMLSFLKDIVFSECSYSGASQTTYYPRNTPPDADVAEKSKEIINKKYKSQPLRPSGW